VQKVATEIGMKVEIRNLENPRKEFEDHYYKPDHKHLLDLGYMPTHNVEAEMGVILQDLIKYRDRIEAKKEVLIPDVRWDGKRGKVKFLSEEIIRQRAAAS